MVLSRIFPKAISAARNITTSAVRRSHGEDRNVPGSNLPFQITNRYRLALGFILFFGSGLAFPYLVLRNAILVKQSAS